MTAAAWRLAARRWPRDRPRASLVARAASVAAILATGREARLDADAKDLHVERHVEDQQLEQLEQLEQQQQKQQQGWAEDPLKLARESSRELAERVARAADDGRAGAENLAAEARDSVARLWHDAQSSLAQGLGATRDAGENLVREARKTLGVDAALGAAPKSKRSGAAATAAATVAAAEQASAWQDVTVARSKPLGEQYQLVRLRLSEPEDKLEYTVGAHVVLQGVSQCVDDWYPFGKRVARPYLPVQPLDRSGHVDVIVKRHKYPDGDTSRFLASAREGDVLKLSPPVVRPHVASQLKSANFPTRKIGIVTGGSGFTAAVQLARTALLEPECEVHILSSHQNAADVFYTRELARLASEHPGRLHVFRTLTRAAPRGWPGGIGRVSEDMVRDNLPAAGPDTTVVVCGPDDFCRHMAGPQAQPNALDAAPPGVVGGVLAQAGHAAEQVVVL